jgi:predicted naringenin-chalcone synthase
VSYAHDALLIERMGLQRTVRRLLIFGLGCVGGVLGRCSARQISVSNGARMQKLMLAYALALMAFGVAVAVVAVIGLLG